MISFKMTFWLLALNVVFAQPTWAQSCRDLFQKNELHETKFQLNEEQIQSAHVVILAPLESTKAVSETFKTLLQNSDLKFLPIHSRFAVNLSRLHQIHLVSEGLNAAQHQQLLTFFKINNVEQILLGVPILFRNRYFEVEIRSHGSNATKIDVQPKLAWDLKVPLESQIITGFASRSTDKIRPYQPSLKNRAERIRADLLVPRFTQETLATCGLASVIKVFKPRKIKYSEIELLQFVEVQGIREIQHIFSSDPGLSLSQAAKLLQILGREHGFSVKEVVITSDDDAAEFAKMARLAAEGRNIDVIVNYYSPVVGRPGGGHFTPVAGYNAKTNEVLLGEVNLAMNPPFWTHEKILIEAMWTQNPKDPPRGYLVITWPDSLKQR